jgi:hypothetical protein
MILPLLSLLVSLAGAQTPTLTVLQDLEARGPQSAGAAFDKAPARVPAPAQGPDLKKRGEAIEDLHSYSVVKPNWLPKFINDVPAYQVVEGPTVDKESFLQRAWRAPLSPIIAPIGGMLGLGKQWSTLGGDGGDTFGRVAGAILGGLFGLIVGALVGVVGAVINAGMAVVDLFKGKVA